MSSHWSEGHCYVSGLSWMSHPTGWSNNEDSSAERLVTIRFLSDGISFDRFHYRNKTHQNKYCPNWVTKVPNYELLTRQVPLTNTVGLVVYSD